MSAWRSYAHACALILIGIGFTISCIGDRINHVAVKNETDRMIRVELTLDHGEVTVPPGERKYLESRVYVPGAVTWEAYDAESGVLIYSHSTQRTMDYWNGEEYEFVVPASKALNE